MMDQNDSRSTQSSHIYQPSTKWDDGGYPWRHRKLLQETIDTRGNPWLVWDKDTGEGLTGATEKLIDGDALLIFLGPRGTGKTQAAVEMSLQLDLHLKAQDRSRVISHFYSPLGELLNKEKASWADRSIDSPLKRARTCGLLVLDEIQESTGSEWERQTLTLLVDDRYRNMKRTILIGNLSLKGLGDFLSDSVRSRSKETGSVIEMAGKRYR
jgi:DNA replication protein DnaC